MKNTISVVIPTHNRPTGLALSLKSILGQTCLPAEIIVVDDGSFPVVEDSIFDSFPTSIKCTLLRNEQPKGGNNARNRGIMAATTDYIAFLDDDDQFKPKKIEVVSKEINDNPWADVIYHPAHIHMLNENLSYYSKPYQFKPDDDVFQLLLVSNRIGGTPMTVVRKQALLDVGLFDEQMPALQDYELWLRIAKKGYKFHLLDIPLTNYHYTTKKGSVSKSLSINAKAISLIEGKYLDDYEKLSESQVKAYKCWKKKMIVHKSLLNGNLAFAIKSQFKLFIYSPSIINLASIFVMILGPKAIFKLKAKLG